VGLWARLIAALAVVRVAAALTLYAAGSIRWIPPVPSWIYAVLAATFSLIALGLLLGHQNDRRAAWLGGILALIGCPLATPFLDSRGGPICWLLHIRPDAFLGTFLWEFVACFPTDLPAPRANLVRGIGSAGVAVGFYLAGGSLLGIWASAADIGTGPALVLALSRSVTASYWPLLLGLSVPAFFGLLWRAWGAEGGDRRRVQVFVVALLAGLGPVAVEVFVEGIWPAYEEFVHRPGVEPWFGAVIFATLASLPVTTTYSVLFDRVVSVRLVLRKAIQYAFARYTILAVTLIPFVGLVLFVAQRRSESLIKLLSSGQRPIVLGGLAIVGGLALRIRPRLLTALDRRYFREPFDGRRILERLMARSSSGVSDLGAQLTEELSRAFHATVSVLLTDDTRTLLRDSQQRLQPLSAMTPLLNLAGLMDDVLDIGVPGARQWVERLPEHERVWLAVGSVRVIAPIRSYEFGPVGLIALTARISELPYTSEDRRFLGTVATAACLALGRPRLGAPATADALEQPARECERCLSVYASRVQSCICGAALADAPVPHVLRGVFRFEQRIAAGSTGVVYRAVDLSLGRNVAIKLLTGVTSERRAALVREARAMACVAHPNLAVVHGVETWRAYSFLVQEYLEKGTLALRLSTSRLAVADAIEIGTILSDLLQSLHRDNLIHCDIKPSNIGYTAEDVVKLFDFGLAKRLGDLELVESREATSALVGTPLYMSPEAIRGDPPSPASDLWSLSVVLYEAIAGRRPFDGATTADVLAAILRGGPPYLTDVAPTTPDSVAGFFVRALSRDRTLRPRSASEFGSALAELRRSLQERTALPSATLAADALGYGVKT